MVAHFLAFASGGQVIHIRVLGLTRYDDKIEAAAVQFAETMALDAGALPTEHTMTSAGAEFSASLPKGWRIPLAPELEAIRKITAKVGEQTLSPEHCMVGIRALAVGDPDVIFSCSTYLHLGPVDEHSFEGEEAVVHEKFFGRSEKPVARAESITVGDRVGFYYRPPVAGATYRLALAPYSKGMMMTWGIGNQLDDAGLDAAMQELLPTVTFDGPEGGAPIISPDKWLLYYLKHRPSSPPVLLGGLSLIGLIGGVVMFGRKKKPSLEDI